MFLVDENKFLATYFSKKGELSRFYLGLSMSARIPFNLSFYSFLIKYFCIRNTESRLQKERHDNKLSDIASMDALWVPMIIKRVP